ncbi:hypothetical protein KEM48_008258 [Puccinia striiformis f. sp. tritici PST-130]|nr:hypothetical protein KEM48_008258 [Puccinia striiformis f. sp. tritici PST-130]
MHFSSCCSSGSIGYPPDTNVMTLNGAGAYKAICVDAKALDSELGSQRIADKITSSCCKNADIPSL